MGSIIIFVHHYERRKGTPDNVALLEQLREESAGVKKFYPEATGKYIAMLWKGIACVKAVLTRQSKTKVTVALRRLRNIPDHFS